MAPIHEKSKSTQAARTQIDAASSRRAAFELRCWARAQLFAAGELELSEAVDRLQCDAERDGLVDAIGQDEVQRILSEAFGSVR
jgi:hypothetical protein